MRGTKPNLLLFNIHELNPLFNLWYELFDTRMQYEKWEVFYSHNFYWNLCHVWKVIYYIKLYLTMNLNPKQYGLPFHINEGCKYYVHCYWKINIASIMSTTYACTSNLSTDKNHTMKHGRVWAICIYVHLANVKKSKLFAK